MNKLSEIKRQELLKNGIYIIKNKISNKFYIGSCSSKTFLYERLKHHQQDLKLNKHINKHLQNSYNKHGEDNFYYEVLEVCKPDECVEREQYWIDLLNPHYNFCKKAGSTLGTVCSEATKSKISLKQKENWRNPEFIEKMRIVCKNKKPRIRKVKVKKEFHGLCKKVIHLDTNKVYNSVIEASKDLNITYNFLIAVLNKQRKSTKNVEYVK